ncbi:MAG: hypothetical protein KJ709_08465 [Nanoarchaeota archaeon]|nr:hypothetical protein [Nanoarchaeota archaeon]
MTLSKTVRISELYPSRVEDLTKTFRNVTRIHAPYGGSRGGTQKRMIQMLVDEVERELDISDPDRTNGPYSNKLKSLVDAVNRETTELTEDPEKQVPEEIRFMQLAHFQDPEVDGQVYSYGLFLHYGTYGTKHTKELAVLLPYERDETLPALILSNNWQEDYEKTLGLLIKAIAYGREKAAQTD